MGGEWVALRAPDFMGREARRYGLSASKCDGSELRTLLMPQGEKNLGRELPRTLVR